MDNTTSGKRMAQIKLKPEMSRKDFERATRMKVLFRDKGKTGVSFKIQGLAHLSEQSAKEKAARFANRYTGCTVKVIKARVPSFVKKTLWNVRVVLPLAK